MSVPMTEITTKMVAELRARTGAGMMDCKKALVDTGGDLEKAVELLRQKGQAKGDKRAGREATEGTVAAYVAPDGRSGALVELNSETDFVARTPEFGALARDLARHVADTADAGDVTEQVLLGDPGRTVGAALKALAGKTGEHVALRRTARFARAGDGRLETYVHFNGQVGVLLELACPAAAAGRPEITALAKDLTLHIASTKPIAVTTAEVAADVIERERRVYAAQVDPAKPEAIREKIVEGKLRKFYEERVLVEQPFVKDDKQRIRDLLGAAGKAVGGDVAVRRFACFEVGGA
jgi:elongation factor Ts